MASRGSTLMKPTTSSLAKQKVPAKLGDAKSVPARSRVTVSREPSLETARRAQQHGQRQSSVHVDSNACTFKARPLNKKILQAPTMPLTKKGTLHGASRLKAQSSSSSPPSLVKPLPTSQISAPSVTQLQSVHDDLAGIKISSSPDVNGQGTSYLVAQSTSEELLDESEFGEAARNPEYAENTINGASNLGLLERGAHKERKIIVEVVQNKIEERAIVPQANPYPCTTDYLVVPPNPVPTHPTKPEPFQLASLVRHEEEMQKELEERERRVKEVAETGIFKAQPILKEDPIHVPALNDDQKVKLHVVERANFDPKVSAPEEEEEDGCRERNAWTSNLDIENQAIKLDGWKKLAMVKLVIQRYTREAALARAAAVIVAEQEQAVSLSKYVHQLSSPLLDKKLSDGAELEMEVIPMGVNNNEISYTFRVDSPLVVDEAMLEKVLGPPRFGEREAAERVAAPGISVGLVWTTFGGEVQFVEATTMVGNGELQLTEQLGGFIKESAQIALTWVRARATDLQLVAAEGIQLLEGRDIHIHFPAGAVPKDGPSAGVTLVTALVLLLSNKRVRADTAMTGEMTLRGLVLPVGGIKDKLSVKLEPQHENQLSRNTTPNIFHLLTEVKRGAAVSMHKYMFDGEAWKISLDIRNLDARTSFLLSVKLELQHDSQLSKSSTPNLIHLLTEKRGAAMSVDKSMFDGEAWKIGLGIRNLDARTSSLVEQERGAEKEKYLIMEVVQNKIEEEKAIVPKADPYPIPCTTDYLVVPPKPVPKHPSKPEPFQLESLVRHEVEMRKELEEREKKVKEEAEMRIFKAQPILKEDPIPVLEKVRKPLTEGEKAIVPKANPYPIPCTTDYLVVPPNPVPKQPTKPEPFQLASLVRHEEEMQKELEEREKKVKEEAETRIFKAKPILKEDPIQVPEKVRKPLTEEEKAIVHEANPYPIPCTTDYLVVPPNPVPKHPTKPEPFQLASLVRHEEEMQKELEEREKKLKEEADKRIFKEQPILKEDPIPVLEKVRQPLTEVHKSNLHLENRGVEMADFDPKVSAPEGEEDGCREKNARISNLDTENQAIKLDGWKKQVQPRGYDAVLEVPVPPKAISARVSGRGRLIKNRLFINAIEKAQPILKEGPVPVPPPKNVQLEHQAVDVEKADFDQQNVVAVWDEKAAHWNKLGIPTWRLGNAPGGNWTKKGVNNSNEEATSWGKGGYADQGAWNKQKAFCAGGKGYSSGKQGYYRSRVNQPDVRPSRLLEKMRREWKEREMKEHKEEEQEKARELVRKIQQDRGGSYRSRANQPDVRPSRLLEKMREWKEREMKEQEEEEQEKARELIRKIQQLNLRHRKEGGGNGETRGHGCSG